jgi:hypothetical protein
MQVSHIFIADKDGVLPEYLQQCIQQVKTCCPEFPHVLYDHSSLREVLRQRFHSEVLHAFDILNPYAYKADLGKYCLLYAFGGWYFDLAVRPLAPITFNSNVATIAFSDKIEQRMSWTCSTAVIYSKPGDPVFQTAIEKVVQNCKARFYGIESTCPTGPGVLGASFAEHGGRPDRIFGDYQYLTPAHKIRNPGFVLPNGFLFALAKTEGLGGDLKSLGATGVNNYNEFWNTKSVYK